MDISEVYIKMCEQAREIQVTRKLGSDFEEGDYFCKGNTISLHIAWEAMDGSIWLPRQDQLQDMVATDLGSLIMRWCNWLFPKSTSNEKSWSVYDEKTGFTEFNLSFTIGDGIPEGKLTSMEQLWLAFVMKEKYA